MIKALHTEMIPDIYLSPGFYMGFWEACIEKLFTADQIKNHIRLQQHRELRIGAILAAAITRQSKIQHFVGIPDKDPPDVLIMHQEPAYVKDKAGTEPKYMHVEVVRCDFNNGENPLEQALIKNKPTYQKMNVAIDVTGISKPESYLLAVSGMQSLKVVYPRQIVAIEQVGTIGEADYRPGHFKITQLYPSYTISHVWRSDDEAFFRRPTDVIGKATPSRGVTTKWQDLGSFTLLPPSLN